MSRPSDSTDRPPRPRRGLARALAAFMEERNIFWGELVGAALFIGCSVALIITLWDRFSDNALFKLLTFVGPPAALFAAGLYTIRRWKLQSTSRGLLALVGLLAPLALLGMTFPVAGGGDELPAQLIAAAALGFLVYRSGRELLPEGHGLFAAAVIGAAAGQIPIASFVGRNSDDARALLASLPALACAVLALGAYVRRLGRRPTFDKGDAAALFVALPAAGLSLAVTLGLLVYLRDDVSSLASLSVLLAPALIPALAGGLILHHRLSADRGAAGFRLAGTALALASAAALLLCVGLAWPRPDLLLAVCGLNFVALTVVAVRSDLRAAHAAALPCLAIGYLVACALVTGQLDVLPHELASRMLSLATSGGAAAALLGLGAACVVAAEALARLGWWRDGRCYALAGVVMALVSLILVTWRGLQQPHQAALVYAGCAAGALLMNLRWRRPELTILGLVLLVAATLWGLWWQLGQVTPLWAACLAGEALAMTALAMIGRSPAGPVERDEPDRLGPEPRAYRGPLALLGPWVGWGAAALAGWSVVSQLAAPVRDAAYAVTGVCLAALWTLKALDEGRTWQARLASWLTALAVAACVTYLAPLPTPTHSVAALALSLAATAAAMAWCSAGAVGGWRGLFAQPWAETAAGSAVAALLLAGVSHALPVHAGTFGLLAAAAFFLARTHGPALTWLGAVFSLAAVVHGFVVGLAAWGLPHPWLLAVLTHPTLTLFAGLALRRGGEEVATLFALPLSRAALVSSLFSIPFLLDPQLDILAFRALGAVWLAALWGLAAVAERWPALFAAGQVALYAAAVLGVAAWLLAGGQRPDTLGGAQACAVAIAGLGLGWVLVRRWLRDNETARALLSPPWPSGDRAVTAALLPGQLLLAVAGIVPGLAAELVPAGVGWGAVLPDNLLFGANEGAAWLVPALLAVALLLEAGERSARRVILGLVAIGLTVPVLTAAAFADQRAVASALRWGLALTFIVCSLPLWLRDRVRGWRDVDADTLTAARRLLVAGAVVPVVALTLAPLAAVLVGQRVPGPLPDSWFAGIGRAASATIPLALVCFGLVVHALRERLPGYAFGVGLGFNLAASLLVRYGHRGAPPADWWVELVLANVLACAATALMWLAARRRLYGEDRSGPLLAVQMALAPALLLGLLAALAGVLVAEPWLRHERLAIAGGPWGWLALLTTAGAVGWYLLALGWRIRGHYVPVLGLAAGVLAACAVSGADQSEWLAYHVLTVGCWLAGAATVAAGWVASRSSVAADMPQSRGLLSPEVLEGWCAVVGGLLLALTLRGLADDPLRPWWTCGTLVALAALAGAAAMWRRREGWALAASAAAQFAVGVILWQSRGPEPFDELWPRLIQGAVITGALVTLLWLSAARHLYGGEKTTPLVAPLLNLQVALLVVGNLVLLVAPAVSLIAEPWAIPDIVAHGGSVAGWLALLLTLGVVAWHAGRVLRQGAIHLLCGLGLAAAVLLACTAAWVVPEPWVGFRVLMLGVGLTGAAAVALGARRNRGDTDDAESEERAAFSISDNVNRVQSWWVAALAMALVGLSLRGAWADPSGAWWSAGAVAVAGGLALAMAVLHRREGWAFAAGLAALLAPSLVVARSSWGIPLAEWWLILLQTNVIAGASAALLWQTGRQRLHGGGSAGVSPLLHLYLAAVAIAAVVAVALPAAELIARPDVLTEALRQAGSLGGGLATALALIAVARQLRPLVAEVGIHAIGAGLLALGVAVARFVGGWEQSGWAAYHALLVGWGVAGLGTLAAGAVAARQGRSDAASAAHLWIVAAMALLAGLAGRGALDDPTGHAWSAGGLAAAAALAAALAVWQRRETWALLACFGVEAAVSLLLADMHRGEAVADWWVRLVQVNEVAGAAAAMAWLAVGRRLRGDAGSGLLAAPLLSLQVGLVLIGSVALLVGPAVLLIAHPVQVAREVQQAGTPWGWLTLLAGGAASVWHVGRALTRGLPHLLCALGVALGVLAACSASWWDAGDLLAYRVLMAAWVATAAGALAGAMLGRSRGDEALPGWSRAWVGALGLIVVGLALRGLAIDLAGPWWWAGAVAAVGVLAAVTALCHRSERWAGAASLASALAVGVVLWHGHQHNALGLWWRELMRGEVLTLAGTAALWLLTGRRLYGTARPTLNEAPLLTVQTALALGGALVLLAPSAVGLITDPGRRAVSQSALAWDWLALLGAGAVAAVHAVRTLPRCLVHILGTVGLAAGVLTACSVADWSGEPWAAYRTLLAAWAIVAASMFIAAAAADQPGAVDETPNWDNLTKQFCDSALRWLTAVSLAVVALALRAAGQDPAGEWWPAGAVLAVSTLAGARALWQRREGWAFVAGVGVNLAVSLVLWREYVLFDPGRGWLLLLQGNIIASAAVALLWLGAYRRLYPDRPPGLLLNVQVALGLAGNVALLAVPLAWLVVWPHDVAELPALAGDAWGWAALLAAGAVALRHLGRVGGRLGVHLLCGVGLALGVLAACTAAGIESGDRWLAYHVLTTCWCAAAFVVLSAGWGAERRGGAEASRPARAWALAFAALVLALAVRGAADDPLAPWWSFGATLAVTALFVAFAAWRQHEGWAFAAGVTFNLAMTLLFAQLQRDKGWDEWWTVLVQINILSSAVTTLIWIAVRRRRYLDRAPDPFASPLLSIKIALELAGNALLLVAPVALLVAEPGEVHPLVIAAGDVLSWLALGLSLAAACWHFGEIAGRFGVSVLCGLGLTLGALAASTAGQFDTGNWLAYHTLTVIWATTAVVLPVVAWRKNSAESAGPGFPVPMVRRWLLVLALLVGGLALRGAIADPSAPWWSAAALAAVSASAGVFAAWQRSGRVAFSAGLVLNLAATLVVWHGHRGAELASWWVPLVQVNVLACAGVAALWLLGRARLYRSGEAVPALSPLLTAQVTLGLLGNAAVLLYPALRLVARPEPIAPQLAQAGTELGWLALAAALAAALVLVRQTGERAGRHLLYALGLALGVLAACTAGAATGSGWVAYRVLMSAWAALAAVTLAAGWLGRREAAGWLAAVLLLVTGLAVRAVGQDPAGLAWPGAAFLAVGLLAGCAAVWLRSEPWAVAGGAALNAAASLLVWHFHEGDPLASWILPLVQVNLIACATTALMWLGGRRLLGQTGATGPWATGQVAVSLAGCVLLLAGGVGSLLTPSASAGEWTHAAASRLGWAALLLAGVAGAAWARARGLRLRLETLTLVGLAALGQIGCTVGALEPGWGYRTLMLGCAAWSLGLVQAARRMRPALVDETNSTLDSIWEGKVSFCVAGVAALAVALSLNGAVAHLDRLWAAAAVALVGAAGAAMAVWLRREAWAFLAGATAHLAVSLVLWHLHADQPLQDWLPTLLERNVLTAALVALVWLAVWRRIDPGAERGLSAAPLLTVQVSLALLGGAVLLAAPLAELLLRPGTLTQQLKDAGQPWVWLTLAAVVAAGVWHAGRHIAAWRAHIVCPAGLALGVLIAASFGAASEDPWLAYRALTVSWLLVGAAAIGAGWLTNRDEREQLLLVSWVGVIGALVVALAVRGLAGRDPAGLHWAAAVVAAVGVLWGVAALWARGERWMFAAGLALQLAVSFVAWQHRVAVIGPRGWLPLMQANALGAACVGLFWLAARRRLYGTARPEENQAPTLRLQVAIVLSLNVIGPVTAFARLITYPAAPPAEVALAGGLLGWLGFVGAALVVLWHSGAILRKHVPGVLTALGLPAAVLAAGSAAAMGHTGWIPYRVLTTAAVAGGALALLVGWLMARRGADDWAKQARASVGVFALFVVALSVRAVVASAAEIPWSAGAVVAAAGLAAAVALWQRLETWAVAAGLAVNLAVSLLTWHAHQGEPFAAWWVPLVQVNALVWAGTVVAWLASGRRSVSGPSPLLVQVAGGVLASVALLIEPAAALLSRPTEVTMSIRQAGSLGGWAALLATAAAAWWYGGRALGPAARHLLGALGLLLGVQAACTAGLLSGDGWAAYRVLMGGWSLLAVALLVEDWLSAGEGADVAPSVQGWVTAVGLLVAVLAARALGQDPAGPLGSAFAFLVVSLLAGCLAIRARREEYVYASGLFVNAAGVALWLTWGQRSAAEFVYINVLGLGVSAGAWHLLRPWSRGVGASFSAAAARLGIAAVLALVGIGLANDLAGNGATDRLTWPALGAVGAAVALRGRGAAADAYALGLAAVGLMLRATGLTSWSAAPLLAAYAFATTAVWAIGTRRYPQNEPAWFRPAQGLLIAAAAGVGVWACLNLGTTAERFAGALASALLLPSCALIANGGGDRTRWRYAALAMPLFAVCEAGWALLGPTAGALGGLYGGGLLLTASAGLALLYAVVLPRALAAREGWAQDCRRAGLALGVAALALTAVVLLEEFQRFRPGGTAAALPHTGFIVAVGGALVALVVGAICLALSPALDPLRLSERGRTGYVYAAELLLVAAAAHLRLTAPQLFSGRMAEYWTFAVVGLAFAGAAAGELFRRLGLRVLSEPLERTGVFLPLLPLIGFWFRPAGSYAALWFAAGGLYAFLAVARHSLGFLMLAGIAANAGLWAILHDSQLAFVRYPQLWAVPLALSVLAAEYLNRDRLTRSQRNGIRHGALWAIYLSSAAEALLPGLAHSAVRPLVLVALSVLGVLSGMALRVRAFLFLGTLFLMLGLFAVVRHAASVADQSRIIWLVAGIVLGVLIFAAFAVFEKRRNDVLALWNKVKQWD